MTTIKDLANITGVSPTTVSNVIHGRVNKVSPETLAKVQNAIEQTNYTLNMGGRLLSKRGSRIIGVITHSGIRLEQTPLQDPFFSVILGALEQEIRENGYFMMMYTSAQTEESLRMAASWDVDGMIVLGCNGSACEELFSSTTKPIVFIDSYYDKRNDAYYNVGLQDRAGGYIMTQYLIGQGHRSIAFLADAEEPVGVDFERYEGVKEALDEHGIPYAAENYIHISHNRRERHQILRAGSGDWLKRFTALFFASDLFAADAIGVLTDLGIDVPGQISVCGFDGNLYSMICRPMLTTIEQNVPQKAVRAVDLLMRRINGEKIEKKNILLGASLCVRNSTRPIRTDGE